VDLGVLVAVPLESIVVRAVVATLGVVVVVRLLLRLGMRSSHARIATALAPAAALVVVVLLTGTSMRPPMLMFPADGARAIPIPVRDGSLNFAPIAIPLLVAIWASIAGFRLFRRSSALLQVRRAAVGHDGQWEGDEALHAVAARVASSLEVPAPRVMVRSLCPGGAFVVGTRRPVIVIGADLLGSLDHEELEGVLAHELAHVRRHDTFVATALGALRDLTFFVPGGGWAIRQLHRERELAADQVAVRVTRRPGALASGLLKVLEANPSRDHACAALVPSGNLVDRVRVLVEDAPAPTRLRRSSETAAVVLVVVSATTAALVLPTAIAGPEQQRDALAFVWSSTPAVTAAEVPTGEARVFDVYRRGASLGNDARTSAPGPRLDERTQENRRATLHACAVGACPIPERTLSLRLQPTATPLDEARSARWNATQVGRSDTSDGFRLFWLARFE
jgi:beta-lactamase regulating signal transducer with metallopeptidase domain